MTSTMTTTVGEQTHLPKNRKQTTQKQYTREQVATHTKEDDLWIIIGNSVYDVSGWWNWGEGDWRSTHKHPGGKIPLQQLAGRDATLVFTGYHPQYVIDTYLEHFCIGSLADPVSELANDFVKLDKQMKLDGMYDTSAWDYVPAIIVICVSFAASLYCALTNTIIGAFFAGVFMALFWQQTAFIGHDCGHNAVTHDKHSDWWIGKLVTLAFGVSGEWWRKSHNAHHVTPNSIDWDPDIQHLPFLAIDKQCLDGFYSFYHGHEFLFDGIAASFIPRQSFLFLPILGFSRLFMNIHSIIRCFQPDLSWFKSVAELITLGLYWSWFLAFCWFAFETTPLALLFVWSAHNFVGILHMQITLSHFSMDAYLGRVKPEVEEDVGASWIRLQTETTMDVDTYTWMDWFHGGLQYQCIHHLYPRVARHKLRHVRDTYVVPFLEEHGITYHSNSWFHVFGEVFRHLGDQSALVKKMNVSTSFLGEAVLAGGVVVYLTPVLCNFVTIPAF